MPVQIIPNLMIQDPRVVDTVLDTCRRIDGFHLLKSDYHHDTRRLVITALTSPEALFSFSDLAMQSLRFESVETIQSTHPFVGLLDVFPILPTQRRDLAATLTMVQALANHLHRRFALNLFYYGLSSHRRVEVSTVRRGGLAELRTRLSQGAIRCDLLAEVDSPYGFTSIGVRQPMVAINFGVDGSLDQTRSLVKALLAERRQAGFHQARFWPWASDDNGSCEVATNVLDSRLNLGQLFGWIATTAQEHGLKVSYSELIGLVRTPSLLSAAQWFEPCQTLKQAIEIVNRQMRFDQLKSLDEKVVLESVAGRLGIDLSDMPLYFG